MAEKPYDPRRPGRKFPNLFGGVRPGGLYSGNVPNLFAGVRPAGGYSGGAYSPVGGRTGAAPAYTPPAGKLAFGIEMDPTGTMWRYYSPGSGWYSQWMPKSTPPPMASLQGQMRGGGGAGVGGYGYYDPRYGAERTGPDTFAGTLNAYGQPVGTLAPWQRQGGGMRASPQYVGGPTGITPDEIQEQINQIQKMLRGPNVGREGSYTAARSQGRKGRLELRLNKLLAYQKARGGGNQGTGLSGMYTGGSATWNP